MLARRSAAASPQATGRGPVATTAANPVFFYPSARYSCSVGRDSDELADVTWLFAPWLDAGAAARKFGGNEARAK